MTEKNVIISYGIRNVYVGLRFGITYCKNNERS